MKANSVFYAVVLAAGLTALAAAVIAANAAGRRRERRARLEAS